MNYIVVIERFKNYITIKYLHFIHKRYELIRTMDATTSTNQVIDALKAVIKSALCQGFSTTSYLVTNHIKYIKNIQLADNPERYILYTAKKLFPDNDAVIKKSEYIKAKYRDNLLQRFEELYTLYQNIIQENRTMTKRTISEIEADNILEELLY